MQCKDSVCNIRSQLIGITKILRQHRIVIQRLLAVNFREPFILSSQVHFEPQGKFFPVHQVHNPDADPRVLINIARSDAALCRADLARAASVFVSLVKQPVIRQNDLRPVRNLETRHIDAFGQHRFDFL